MKQVLSVVFVIAALSLYANGAQEMESDDTMMKEDTMMSDDTMTADDDMMKDDTMMSGGTMGGKLDFSTLEDAQMYAKEGPAVLFFYATWCPTCKAAMKEFNAHAGDFGDIALYIVDYDNSDDLQKKYGVSYQHTFVQIDPHGEALVKWNGGDFDKLLAAVKRSEMM